MSAPTTTRPSRVPAAPTGPAGTADRGADLLEASRWRLALVSALAVVLASQVFHLLLEGSWWLGRSVALVMVVAATGMAVRAIRAPAPVQPLLQAVALLAGLVLLFARDAARWGFLPGPAAIGRLRELAASGRAYAEQTAAPADFDPGLLLLVAAGIGLIALVVDTLAVGLDLPGLTLVPFAGLFAVAWGIKQSAPSWAFAFVAVAWLMVLAATQRDRAAPWGAGTRPGSLLASLGIGTLAIAIALASGGLTQLRGPLRPILDLGFGPGGGPVSLDALVSLRRSLVENDRRVVLTFATTSRTPEYLRLGVLETFDGEQWRRSGEPELGPRVPQGANWVGWAAGPLVDYTIDVGPLTGTTLPSPSGTVATLVGWPVAFDQRTSLPVRTDGATIEGERIGLVVATSGLDADLLRGASTGSTGTDSDGYPYGLHPETMADPTPLVGSELGDLAREVTAGAESPYDAALALQRWFRTEGGFRYSTDIEGGSSGDALADFLTERVGYCEQFSATMALMARTLGIPARVVVGFTHGRREGGQWVVRGTDAHAWPELWMGAAGWVRFEPTPAATASVPAWARPTADDSDSSASPSPSASASDRASEGPDRAPELDESAGGGGSGSSGGLRWWMLALPALLLLLLAPLFVRVLRRRRRLALGDGESALAEVEDTLVDLGLPSRGATPRATIAGARDAVSGSRASADPGVDASLGRILRAVEWQRYGRPDSAPARRGALAGDISTVRQALASPLRRRRRIRALLVPRSLFGGRRPGRQPADPRAVAPIVHT